MGIFKLSPFLSSKVWAGDCLGKINPNSNIEHIGESLEVSTLDKNESTVEGVSLSEKLGCRVPYIVKFIDTSDNLSVQVHPDDAYAKLNENSTGKSECWIILAAAKGAGIYLGLKDFSKEKFENGIKQNEDMSSYLNFHLVSPGEFFFVPAGTVHAIGSGILLAEVQQSSGITYRVWDWNRLGLDGRPRALHVSKSLDVINFEESKNKIDYFAHINCIFDLDNGTTILEHREFNTRVFNLMPKEIESLKVKKGSSIISLTGNIKIKSINELFLNEYQSAFVFNENEDRIEIENVHDDVSSFLLVS